MNALVLTIDSNALCEIVTLAGELDVHTAAGLARELLDVAASSGGRIVCDLSGLTFLDSPPQAPLSGQTAISPWRSPSPSWSASWA